MHLREGQMRTKTTAQKIVTHNYSDSQTSHFFCLNNYIYFNATCMDAKERYFAFVM